MTRVIHTGDTHIGYQQYHSPERRADFLAAFRQVLEDAVDDGVDAVVHAGDLFHDRRPELVDVLGTVSALRELSAADVPFLAVVGNHETKRDAQWLDLFESLGLATRLGREPVTVGETDFYGLDYVPRGQREALEYDFQPGDADHAALVAHGLFQPFPHGDWDVEAVLAASDVAFDAVLLGDDHTHRMEQLGETWVTYCGSTERASAAERPDRGYNIVEFDGGAHISRRGLPTREFVFVDVELSPGEGADRVTERVGQHDLAEAVVVVTVTGEGEQFPPAQVEQFIADRGALVARVNDRREFEEESEIAASFADPDDAVRERLKEMGLSEAARGVDEVVRASKTPDSRVTEEVERRVRERVDDPAAFAVDDAHDEASPADGSDADTGADTAVESEGEREVDPTADGAAGAEPAPERSAAGDGSDGEAENDSQGQPRLGDF
jgi:DNA repair exonuclease SbcCD nuclease subunit